MANQSKQQIIEEILNNMEEQSEAERLSDEINFIRYLLNPKKIDLGIIKHCRTLIFDKLVGMQKEYEGKNLKEKVKTISQAKNLQLTILTLILLDQMCQMNIEAAKQQEVKAES